MFPVQHIKSIFPATLMALASLIYSVTGYCAVAGRADFIIGDVEAVAADGTKRTLAKGAVINSGESINTAASARAQIRFTDGGYISLQPNSQFRVDEYQYENKTDGKEKGFFSLLKGSVRAITGAIGSVNRNMYQVTTASATIGVRGTGYNATLNDGLFVSVSEGAISLTNKAGTLVVNAGDSAFVANQNTMPVFTTQKPMALPTGFLAPLPNTSFSESEKRDSNGDLNIIGSQPPT